MLSIHLIAPGVWKSGEYLRGGCPTKGGPGRNAQAQLPRVCRPGWWARATRPETGSLVQLSSAQVGDGSGRTAQDCEVTERIEKGVASSRPGPVGVSTEGLEEGGPTTPGTWEMSADETKRRRPDAAVSSSGLVRPKHRVDSVLPACGGQAEHGPGRPGLQMGWRIICLPNARTSGPRCVSSRRDAVAEGLQHTTCRRLTGLRVGGAACTSPKQMPVPSLTAAWR